MDLLCFSVLRSLCLCARLFICASWSPAGKVLTSWLPFVVSNCELSLSHWYPGSGVVLDCVDSSSLHPYLLLQEWESQLGLNALVHNLPELAAEESMSPDTGLSQQFFSYVGTGLPGMNQY